MPPSFLQPKFLPPSGVPQPTLLLDSQALEVVSDLGVDWVRCPDEQDVPASNVVGLSTVSVEGSVCVVPRGDEITVCVPPVFLLHAVVSATDRI